jgi:alpha-tubulin suppressor-like RCC1 family protein
MGVKAIAASGGFTCVLLSDASVRCWGDNRAGECGQGMSGGSCMPVSPMGLSNVAAIATGLTNVCALLMDGTVDCWGTSSMGEIGPVPTRNDCNPLTKCVAVPTAVPGVTGAKQIAIGHTHVCAVVAGGALVCWGSDVSGELGRPTTESCFTFGLSHPCSTTPAAVPGLTSVLEVTAGDEFTCARRAGADVRCFGHGDSGQLGDGMLSTRTMPAAVTW